MLYGNCEQCGKHYSMSDGDDPFPLSCRDCGGTIKITGASGPDRPSPLQELLERELNRKPPSKVEKFALELGYRMFMSGIKGQSFEEFYEEMKQMASKFLKLGLKPEEFKDQLDDRIRQLEHELEEDAALEAQHKEHKKHVDDSNRFASMMDIAFGDIENKRKN